MPGGRPKTKKVPIRKTTPSPAKTSREAGDRYYCAVCGSSHASQQGYFIPTQSPIWAGNNGYAPICKQCGGRLFEHYQMAYGGDTPKAIRRMCMLLDIYYNAADVELAISSKINGRSEFEKYMARTKIGGSVGKTFDTSIDEERQGITPTFSFITNDFMESEYEKSIIPDGKKLIDSYERWGTGLEPSDYPLLDGHYKMLKKNNPNIDNNQEIFIKDLCNINLMKVKAMSAGNLDSYVKASEQYSKIFARAGLKTVDEKDTVEETVGVTLSTISKYTPEEFYKNKNLYTDYDKLGEYYDRHVRRPLQNIITGSDIRDTEYHVPEEGEVQEDGQEE